MPGWGLGCTEERRVSCLRRELLFRGDRETDRQTWRRRGEQAVRGKSIPRATCVLTHSWELLRSGPHLGKAALGRRQTPQD